MELIIVDENAPEMGSQFGLSEQRKQALSKKLDELVHSYGQEPIVKKTSHVFRDIAKFCENEVELVWCTVLHCGWHQKRGSNLASRIIWVGTL